MDRRHIQNAGALWSVGARSAAESIALARRQGAHDVGSQRCRGHLPDGHRRARCRRSAGSPAGRRRGRARRRPRRVGPHGRTPTGRGTSASAGPRPPAPRQLLASDRQASAAELAAAEEIAAAIGASSSSGASTMSAGASSVHAGDHSPPRDGQPTPLTPREPRGTAPRRHEHEQRRDRRRTVHQYEDCQRPRLEHPRQTRRQLAGRRRRRWRCAGSSRTGLMDDDQRSAERDATDLDDVADREELRERYTGCSRSCASCSRAYRC